MNDPNLPESASEITRREWLLRLGELVVLAGVSGLVPESAATQLTDDAQEAANLPPGLYVPSAEHLVHALQGGGKLYSIPPGSETEYAQPAANPFQPQFFSQEEFRIVTRFVEIILGKTEPRALAQTTQWLDLWLHSAAGVQEAARRLDPLHRTLAVAYYGEESVRELETSNPQEIVRSGLAALHDLSTEKHGREFLDLADSQQVELIRSINTGKTNSPLRKFFDAIRNEAIRGYYTSAEGLKELDYKGNAYYPECPGCPADQKNES